MKHVNIPIFIPHLGCPNQCIFCNQRYISGTLQFDESEVERSINQVLRSVSEDCECEIAFFGGSFTGIDRELMIRLLDTAQKYVDSGRVIGIRMSTRPDYINEEIVFILKKYSITFVELGIQTMNDFVLEKLKRGHKCSDTVNATKILVKNGIKFVGQMMIGLPYATPEDEIYCAEMICKLGASATRIYPTLVFKHTELEMLTVDGTYMPLSIENAVNRSADVLDVFVKNNVECIRIGLCESDNLHSVDTFYAGPNHPSIGEMVKSALYLKKIESQIEDKKICLVDIICPVGAVSQIVGNKKKNTSYLKKKYGIKAISVKEKAELKPFEIKILEKEDERCI